MWTGYYMFFRKQCMLASGNWVNFCSDKCTEISLVWNQFIISSCFEACGVQGFHLQEVCARDQFCILPRMKKPMTLFHIKNYFSCHVILLKRNFQHVGHKWVICRSHPDCSVGQRVKWINRCDPLSTLLGSLLCDMTSPLALRIEFDSTTSL